MVDNRLYAEVVVHTPLGRRVVRSAPVPQAEDTDNLPPPASFHYSIPDALRNEILVGHLVWVPFGSRQLQGVVLSLSDTSPVAETRDILALLDPQPVLTPYQIALARWISEYYMAPLHLAIWNMLPPGIGYRESVILTLAESVPDPTRLSPMQQKVVDLLRSRGSLNTRQLSRFLRDEDWRSAVEGLVRQGVLRRSREIQGPRARPRQEEVIRLTAAGRDFSLDDLRGAKQRVLLDYLQGRMQGDWVPVAAVLTETGTTRAQLRGLLERGLIEWRSQEVRAALQVGCEFAPTAPPRFTPEQEMAWREIAGALEAQRHRVFLLHGVTGSGKTEIYLRAVGEVLARGLGAIVLVPEIALTPQTIRRFTARFPGHVATLHSNLTVHERYSQWLRVRSGEASVVVGSRSAVFAPVANLGLIVVDEEHEWSYKQDQTPYYHARDVAIQLGRIANVPVILGSATPDVGSYYRAVQGEYTLLELPQRILGHRRQLEKQADQRHISAPFPERIGGDDEGIRYMELPPVLVVDLRQELRAGNRGIFSRALQKAMSEALSAGEQVILFLNRRGAATFVMCRDCGHVLRCPRCNVSLTYHGEGHNLICHHCNYRLPMPDACPQCMSARIKFFGIGTQKVQEVTEATFPGVRTLRWDRDVTGAAGSHERILEKFINHEADVLIGTQMIAKGLDLPLVTLVGVVSADTALHLPDFRAIERTFQILTQVAGRAGRSVLGGKVIIQTYNPQHYCIQAASRHDYKAFYQQEMACRRELWYPPFSQLVRLVYVHRSARACREEAKRMHRILLHKIKRLGLPETDLVGPAPCFLTRLRGRYRWQIVVCSKDPHALLSGVPLPLGWRVDVDPVSLL
ncbi:MAG: primosomal protein N' [Chloroflexi bacterium]|nr:primosomal protein N' [Chloroflexota bacterium]